MSARLPSGIVRVFDGPDGLDIHPDDAARCGLLQDMKYQLELIADGLASLVVDLRPPTHSPSKETEMSDIHPAPSEFNADEIDLDQVLRFFHYSHLPHELQERSRPFCELARRLVDTTPRNAERSVALRKLLEAKDAAVRAHIA